MGAPILVSVVTVIVWRHAKSNAGCVMAPFDPLAAAIGGALIGLSAILLMLLTGRVAGISGILGDLAAGDRAWRLAFIAGLIAAPLVLRAGGHAFGAPAMPGLLVAALGGLLVG